MSATYSLNNSPSTGTVAIYTGCSQWSTAGWTKLADSDGTTYSSSGTQITGSGTGAHGLGNSNAWFVWRDPSGSGGRQYCIQRANNDYQWRVKYSPSAGFSGGSPSATQTPSATDQVILLGGGTDAAPTFTSWLSSSNGTYHFNVVAYNSSPYGFVWWAFPNGGGVPSFAFVGDPLVSGTYPSGDTDPYIAYCTNTSPFMAAGLSSESAGTGPVGLLSAGNIVQIPYLTFYSVGGALTVVPSSLGTNSWNTDDEGYPMFAARRAALGQPSGSKGISSMMRWAGVNRNTGDTANSKAKVYVGNVLIVSDGSTTYSI